MDPRDLLSAWETGAEAPPAGRAVALGGLIGGAVPDHEPVGRTNARLLRLHRELVGPRLEATVACTGCGDTLAIDLAVADLLGLEDAVVDEPEPLVVGGEDRVVWRPPAHHDLLLVEGGGADALLARCAGAVDTTDRPRVVAAMAAADPLAEVEVEVGCPACGVSVVAEVDLPSFLWSEVDSRARTLLAEVDVLARAYGWSEGQVLDLSPQRRQHYLDLVLEER